ncbi:MAG: hypothetical protein ABT20_09235 [Rubrivivax sp. SCN 70-15]|nr:MAG: hypothetical protein ABT20_09235 [Rubrivivax sp. SCN 70-15]
MQSSRPKPHRRAGIFQAALVLAALLATSLPASAQWMWRDKDKHITASDLPPPHDIPDRDILQRPDLNARPQAPAVAASAGAPGAAASKPPVDPELEARRRAAEQQQQAKAHAEDQKLAAQRADNCRRARSELTALQSGQRMARINGKGEREILDDKGRADEMRRANEVIASECR